MKIFAEHSRHMENSWAKVGAPDAIEFSTAAANLMSDMGRKSFIDFAPLERQIDRTEKAVNVLLKRLPKKYLAECKPQLEQLRRIMQADKVALDSLKSGQLDPRLKVLREEITSNEKLAVISEQAGRKFIDDVLNFFDAQNNGKRKK